ncbi:MAG: hypothetical protein ACRELY_23590, partial [Polyangiaceae bacterium]
MTPLDENGAYFEIERPALRTVRTITLSEERSDRPVDIARREREARDCGSGFRVFYVDLEHALVRRESALRIVQDRFFGACT